MRSSDTQIDTSANGGNWDTLSVTKTGLIASIDVLALGASRKLTPANFADGVSIGAVAWWHGDKDNAALATIYNSGNPWPALGVARSSSFLLLRMIEEGEY